MATRVRVLPFAAFMVLLALRGAVPPDLRWLDARWLYALNVPIVGGLLWWWRRHYDELGPAQRPRTGEVLAAVVVGFVVFAAWIHLDAPWMWLGTPAASFVPLDDAGRPVPALIAARLAGAVLVVPVMEELFWRGWLMRWLHDADFARVEPRSVGWKGLLGSTGAFMLVHPQWLAAIVAGLAFGWLYQRSGRLWLAIIAHATTNAALGAWVIATGQWRFW